MCRRYLAIFTYAGQLKTAQCMSSKTERGIVGILNAWMEVLQLDEHPELHTVVIAN